MALERVPTGIEGLDRLIGGGLVRATWTRVYGSPGVGKTVLGMQFTWEGINRGEVVAYDSLDRPIAYVRAYFGSFGWDIGAQETRGLFVPVQSFPQYGEYQEEPHVMYYNPSSFAEARTVAIELGRRKVRRLVRGDYAEAFWASCPPSSEILDIQRWTPAWAFREGITGIELVSGTPGHPEDDHLRAIHEKHVNNVIYVRVHEGQREMKIIKMEATDHPLDWLPFNITEGGLVL